MEPIPVEAFLESYPPAIRRAANALRTIVRRAVPHCIEAVRPGWRLIGYDVPIGRWRAYFAYVAPESGHVHLGFEHGILMADPDGLLQGADLGLRKVRFLTFTSREQIRDPGTVRAMAQLTRDAARIAGLSREERLALALDREAPRHRLEPVPEHNL